MNSRPPDVKPAALAGAAGDNANATDDAAKITQTRLRAQWRVEIVDPTNGRAKPWAPPYPTRDEAERVAASLRAVKMFARIQRVDVEAPEHRNDRRRFLIAMFMLGAVPPERVVERVVSEIEAEVRT